MMGFRRRSETAALATIAATAIAAVIADSSRPAATPASPSAFAPEILADRTLFCRAYVLARAMARGGGLDGPAAAEEARKAWDAIARTGGRNG